VVIPYFDEGAKLKQALTSVLSQTTPVDEIVIVNDGSSPHGTDELDRIAMTWAGPELSVLFMPKNEGQSAARNLGVKAASNSYIFFLDQDDMWLPNHTQSLRQLLDEGYKLVYSDIVRVTRLFGLTLSAKRFASKISTHRKSLNSEILLRDNYVLPSALAISRSTFMSLGGFDESLRGFEDDEFIVRAVFSGIEVHFLELVTALWIDDTYTASSSPLMDLSRSRYLLQNSKRVLEQFSNEKGAIPRMQRRVAFFYLYQLLNGRRNPFATEIASNYDQALAVLCSTEIPRSIWVRAMSSTTLKNILASLPSNLSLNTFVRAWRATRLLALGVKVERGGIRGALPS
jgi:glycosyltransferase involved in cell wall biosynthesis